MAEIKIENVTKRFGDFIAVDDATLDDQENEFVVTAWPKRLWKDNFAACCCRFGYGGWGRIRIGDRDVIYLPPRDAISRWCFKAMPFST